MKGSFLKISLGSTALGLFPGLFEALILLKALHDDVAATDLTGDEMPTAFIDFDATIQSACLTAFVCGWRCDRIRFLCYWLVHSPLFDRQDINVAEVR